jgi:hypothetical protein
MNIVQTFYFHEICSGGRREPNKIVFPARLSAFGCIYRCIGAFAG